MEVADLGKDIDGVIKKTLNELMKEKAITAWVMDFHEKRRFCKNCKYWQFKESRHNDSIKIGECRYNPPPWNRADEDDWCRLQKELTR